MYTFLGFIPEDKLNPSSMKETIESSKDQHQLFWIKDYIGMLCQVDFHLSTVCSRGKLYERKRRSTSTTNARSIYVGIATLKSIDNFSVIVVVIYSLTTTLSCYGQRNSHSDSSLRSNSLHQQFVFGCRVLEISKSINTFQFTSLQLLIT
ncbi:Uncharacterized protein APZ42_007303, partial [Daphnia magna]